MILPYLLRTFNKAKLYNFCMWMYPCLFVVLSTLNSVARSGYDEESGHVNAHTTGFIWAGLFLVLALGRIGGIAFSYDTHCSVLRMLLT